MFMRAVKIREKAGVKVSGIVGFMIKKVTPFGTGAKVDCPKECIGKEVYMIVTNKKAD